MYNWKLFLFLLVFHSRKVNDVMFIKHFGEHYIKIRISIRMTSEKIDVKGDGDKQDEIKGIHEFFKKEDVMRKIVSRLLLLSALSS